MEIFHTRTSRFDLASLTSGYPTVLTKCSRYVTMLTRTKLDVLRSRIRSVFVWSSTSDGQTDIRTATPGLSSRFRPVELEKWDRDEG